MQKRRPDPLLGAGAGLVAGLVASFAMSQFQKIWGATMSEQGSGGDSATVKAANRASRTTTGRSVEKERKKEAGEAVHYATGAAIGLAYGAAAELRPEVTIGRGTGFGVAVFAVLDEAAVPTMGLSDPPWKTPIETHVYGFVSHLVFGLVIETVRRGIRTLDRPSGVHTDYAIG